MDQLEAEVQRGQFARDLLDNPVYKDTWTQYENQIVDQLRACSVRDADGLQKAVMLLQLMNKFRAMVEHTAETGRMAQLQIQRKSLRSMAAEWIGRDGLTA